MKNPKSAPKLKKALHTFYLVQPVLQFLLLAIAITAFTRCSPLSPSGDKASLKNLDNSLAGTERINSLLNADWVDQSLKSIGETELVMATEQDVSDEMESSNEFRANVMKFVNLEPTASAQVTRAPAILVKLRREDFAKLLHQGKVRHDLSESLAKLKREEAHEALIRLRDQPELVNTTAMLVLSDATETHQEAKLKLRIAVAIVDESHAVLQISHGLTAEDENLKAAAALDAKHLAIVID